MGVTLMHIPVTRDKNNNSELVMLDIRDVVYIVIEDRNVVYHTIDSKYYHIIPSLSVLELHTEQYGFQKLDRINLVNTRKIKQFDDENGKVYFEADASRDSKYATVSFVNKNKMKASIDSWIEKNLNSKA
jgi:DNA-binding LytR/AlgR family response regulator